MSWLFSRALVAEYLRQNSSAGEQSVPLNTESFPQAYCVPDRMTEFSRLSRYGMTFKHLTEERGEALLTSYLEGFHAKRSPQQHEERTFQKRTFGHQCDVLSEKCVRDTCLLKTSPNQLSDRQRLICQRTVTAVTTSVSVLPTWVRIIFGTDFGYLHTPTCTANFAAPSMQKHPSCRNFVTVFGKPSPTNYEYLMGWPIGWTDLKPLETVKFRSWQQSHFSDCGAT